MPAKRTPTSVPTRSMANDGRRGRRRRDARRDVVGQRGDLVEQLGSSADLGESSSEATSSTGRVIF
jgi:hypothetical protein